MILPCVYVQQCHWQSVGGCPKPLVSQVFEPEPIQGANPHNLGHMGMSYQEVSQKIG